jgi:hypothetical protein
VVRFGLLSTAAINGAILGARAADAPFAIVAVGSRDAARAQAYASEHGIERAHGSYEELLADDGVDAVYIALPNALHHEWTMRALAAGKHVLVEKPYTRIPKQVDEAWRAQVGLQQRARVSKRHGPSPNDGGVEVAKQTGLARPVYAAASRWRTLGVPRASSAVARMTPEAIHSVVLAPKAAAAGPATTRPSG